VSAAFVVDASIAIAWILPSQASSSADALLKRIEAGEGAMVPPLWFLEVANGLLVAERRKTIAAPERRLALERLSALGLTVDEAIARDAFGRTSALAEQYGLSVYDAVYLDLAIRRGLPLGTRDRALQSAANRSGIPKLLNDFDEPPPG